VGGGKGGTEVMLVVAENTGAYLPVAPADGLRSRSAAAAAMAALED
jgi:hypothetical protein